MDPTLVKIRDQLVRWDVLVRQDQAAWLELILCDRTGGQHGRCDSG